MLLKSVFFGHYRIVDHIVCFLVTTHQVDRAAYSMPERTRLRVSGVISK